MQCPGGTPTPADGGCEQLSFNFSTQQACTIEVFEHVDGVGYIQANNSSYRVIVINRWGLGHIIGWCDATTTVDMLSAFNVSAYLGQTTSPRVASFGRSVLCDPGANPSSILASQATYLGDVLPEQYMDNPNQLAADWDVIIYCGMYEWGIDYSSTLQRYVACNGKGLLAVMDYRNPMDGGANINDFENMNRLVGPAGFAFEATSIDWASGAGAFSECLPDKK